MKKKLLSVVNKKNKNNENNENKTKKKKKITSHKILIIILAIAIVLVSAVLAGALFIIISAPDFDTDKLYQREATVLTLADGSELARLGAENRDLVSYDELPQVLVDAIVATEDSRFFQHQGFDIARFLMASFGQIAGVSGAGGASTLTMQVVKNTYTSKDTHGIKGLTRKFTDIYMSIFKVEKQYTKEEIIEFYVNAPWLGNGTYGVEQASQLYFGKSVRDLSLPEAALIAGIFNAPATQNPYYSIKNATTRRNEVLNLMHRHGYITEEQLNDAKAISVESTIQKQTGKELNKYQSFIDTVVEEVIADTGLNPYNVPMTIETTLDTRIQDVLNALNNQELGYKFRDDVIQVAIIVTDTNDGSILAVDGRRNQTGERDLNLATGQARFQPGSTAKPIFAYGPAIEYNNESTGKYYFDDPYHYSNGQPLVNADRTYQGQETMRTALSQSRNIPAIEAFQQTDKDKIAEFAHKLGINYGDELYESYSIGGGVYVNPEQMAAAYGAFARGGYYIKPYAYKKITFKDSEEVLENKPKREKVMSEETAYMITSILMTAQASYAGGNFTISGTDVAAKTGTSTYDTATLKKYGVPLDASADNWDITYSPDYVISMWFGYEKLSHDYYTKSMYGSIERKKIMTAIAKKIYKTGSKFEMPSGVVKVEVEKDTVPLALPSAYTPADMRMTELFKEGTEPSETSWRYEQLENPTNGKATISGSSINLSWSPIETPKAINQTELQKYFNENYGDFAQKYYDKRIAYNNGNIGTLGYAVYLNNNGNLQYLGYTSGTSYTYNTATAGNFTFVVKSAYSIFKDNQSSGLEIKAAANSGSGGQVTYNVGSAVLNGNANDVKSIGGGAGGAVYQDPGVTVKDINGSDISNVVPIKKDIVNQANNKSVNAILLSEAGSYIIYYDINNGAKKLTRTVKVQ